MNKQDLKEQVLELALELGAIRYGEFTLASGKTSNYYFDGRLLTLHPRGALLLAKIFLQEIRSTGASMVGGPATGAIPIVAAIVTHGETEGVPVLGFFVRDATKAHGRQRLIEGPFERGGRAVLLDDVCTTAGSLIKAIEEAEREGATVVKTLSILDRVDGGGSETIRSKGYEFMSILKATPSGEVETTKRDLS